MNIEGIKIDINGKSKEEIKKEILDKVAKTLDERLSDDKKESPLAQLTIKAKEVKSKNGFNVEVVDMTGTTEEIAQMLADGVVTAIRGMEMDKIEEGMFVLQVYSMIAEHLMEDE